MSEENRISESYANQNSASQPASSNDIILGGLISSADQINTLQDDVWSTDYTYDDLKAKYTDEKYKNIDVDKFGRQFRQIQAYYNIMSVLAELMRLKSETRSIVNTYLAELKPQQEGLDVVEMVGKENQLKQKYTLIYFNKQFEAVIEHNNTVLKADLKKAKKKAEKAAKKYRYNLTDILGMTSVSGAAQGMYQAEYNMKVYEQFNKQMDRILEQFEKLMKTLSELFGAGCGDPVIDAINKKKSEIFGQVTWENLTVKAGKGGYIDINKNEAMVLRIASVAFQNYLNVYLMVRSARQSMRNAVTQMITGVAVGEGFSDAAISINQTISAFENQMFSMAMEQLFQTVSAYDNYIMSKNAYKKAKVKFSMSFIPFVGAFLGASAARKMADEFKPTRLKMDEVWEILYSRYGIRRINSTEQIMGVLEQKAWDLVAQLDNGKKFKLNAGDGFQALNETAIARIQEELGNIFNIRQTVLLVARVKGKMREIVQQEMTDVTSTYKTDPEKMRQIVKTENDNIRLAMEMKIDTIKKEIAENNRQRQLELEYEREKKRMIYGLIGMVVMVVLAVVVGLLTGGVGLVAILGAAMSGWSLGQAFADAQFYKDRMKNIKTDFHSTEPMYLGGQDQFEKRVQDVFRRAQNWDEMMIDAGNEYKAVNVAKAMELRTELTALYTILMVLHIVGKAKQSFRDIVTQSMGHAGVGDLRSEGKGVIDEKYKTWDSIYKLAIQMVAEEVQFHNQWNKAKHDYQLAQKMFMLSLVSAIVSMVAPMLGQAGQLLQIVTTIAIAVLRYQYLKQAAKEENDFGALKDYSDEQLIIDLMTRKTGNAAFDALSRAEKEALLMMTIELVESVGHGYWGFDNSQFEILKNRIEGIYRVKEAVVESAHWRGELRRAVVKILGQPTAAGSVEEVLGTLDAAKDNALNALEQLKTKIEAYIMRANEINDREKAAYLAKIAMIFTIISTLLSLITSQTQTPLDDMLVKILFSGGMANYIGLKQYDKKVSKKAKKSKGVGTSVYDGKSWANYGADKLAWGIQKYSRSALASRIKAAKIDFEMEKLDRDIQFQNELDQAIREILKEIIMQILQLIESAAKDSGGGEGEGGGEGGGAGASGGAGQAGDVAQKAQQLQQAQEQLQQAQQAAAADPNNIQKQNAVGDAKKNVDQAQKAYQESLKQMEEQNESPRGGQRRRASIPQPNQMPVSDIASYSQLIGQMQEMYFKENLQTLKPQIDTSKPAKSYLDQKTANRLEEIVRSIDPETGNLLNQLNNGIQYANSHAGDTSQIQKALAEASPQAVEKLARAVAQADLAVSQSGEKRQTEIDRRIHEAYNQYYYDKDSYVNGANGQPRIHNYEMRREIADIKQQDYEAGIEKNTSDLVEDISEKTSGQPITQESIEQQFGAQISEIASNPNSALIASSKLQEMKAGAGEHKTKVIEAVQNAILERQPAQNLLSAMETRQQQILYNAPLRSRGEVVKQLKSLEQVKDLIMDKNPAIAQRMIEERKQEFLRNLPTNTGVTSGTSADGRVGQTRGVAGTDTPSRQKQSQGQGGQELSDSQKLDWWNEIAFGETYQGTTVRQDILSRPEFLQDLNSVVSRLQPTQISENAKASRLVAVAQNHSVEAGSGRLEAMDERLVSQASQFINEKMNGATLDEKDFKKILNYLGTVPNATYQQTMSNLEPEVVNKLVEQFKQSIGEEKFNQIVQEKDFQKQAQLVNQYLQENKIIGNETDRHFASGRLAELVTSPEVQIQSKVQKLERLLTDPNLAEQNLEQNPEFKNLIDELAANPSEALKVVENARQGIMAEEGISDEQMQAGLESWEMVRNSIYEKIAQNPNVSNFDKIQFLASKEKLSPQEQKQLISLSRQLVSIENDVRALNQLHQVVSSADIAESARFDLKREIAAKAGNVSLALDYQKVSELYNSRDIAPEIKQAMTRSFEKQKENIYQNLGIKNFNDFARSVSLRESGQQLIDTMASAQPAKVKEILNFLNRELNSQTDLSGLSIDSFSRFMEDASKNQKIATAAKPEIENLKDTVANGHANKIRQELSQNCIQDAITHLTWTPAEVSTRTLEKLNDQELSRLAGREIEARQLEPDTKRKIVGDVLREVRQEMFARRAENWGPTVNEFRAKVADKVSKIPAKTEVASGQIDTYPKTREEIRELEKELGLSPKPTETKIPPRTQPTERRVTQKPQQPQPESRAINADAQELKDVLDQFDKKDPAAEAKLTRLINAYTANPSKLSRALEGGGDKRKGEDNASRVRNLLQNNPQIREQLKSYLDWMAPEAASQQIKNILKQNGIRLAAGPANQKVTEGRPQVEVADLSGKDGFKALADHVQKLEEQKMTQLFEQATERFLPGSAQVVKEGRPVETTKPEEKRLVINQESKTDTEAPQPLGQRVEDVGESQTETESDTQEEAGSKQTLTPEQILAEVSENIDDPDVSSEDLEDQIFAGQNAFVEQVRTGAYNADKLNELGTQVAQLEQKISQSGRTGREVLARDLIDFGNQIAVSEESPEVKESDEVKFLKALQRLTNSTETSKNASTQYSAKSEEFTRTLALVAQDAQHFATTASKLARDEDTRKYLVQIRQEAAQAREQLSSRDPQVAKALEHLQKSMSAINLATSRISVDFKEHYQNAALKYVQRAGENLEKTIANLGAGQLFERVKNNNSQDVQNTHPKIIEALVDQLSEKFNQGQISRQEFQQMLTMVKQELNARAIKTLAHQKVLEKIDSLLPGSQETTPSAKEPTLPDWLKQSVTGQELQLDEDHYTLTAKIEPDFASKTATIEVNIGHLQETVTNLSSAISNLNEHDARSFENLRGHVLVLAQEVDGLTSSQFEFTSQAQKIDFQSVLKSGEVNQQFTEFFGELVDSLADQGKTPVKELDSTRVGSRSLRQDLRSKLEKIQQEVVDLRTSLVKEYQRTLEQCLAKPDAASQANQLLRDLPVQEQLGLLSDGLWSQINKLEGKKPSLRSARTKNAIQKIDSLIVEYREQSQLSQNEEHRDQARKMADRLENNIWEGLKKEGSKKDKIELVKSLEVSESFKKALLARIEAAYPEKATATSPAEKKVPARQEALVKPTDSKSQSFIDKFVEQLRGLFLTSKTAEPTKTQTAKEVHKTPEEFADVVQKLSSGVQLAEEKLPEQLPQERWERINPSSDETPQKTNHIITKA